MGRKKRGQGRQSIVGNRGRSPTRRELKRAINQNKANAEDGAILDAATESPEMIDMLKRSAQIAEEEAADSEYPKTSVWRGTIEDGSQVADIFTEKGMQVAEFTDPQLKKAEADAVRLLMENAEGAQKTGLGIEPVDFSPAVKEILSGTTVPKGKLPTTAKEYDQYLKQAMGRRQNEWAESYDNDMLLMRRHEAVRRHVRDVVETYLLHCSIDKRNVNVMFNPEGERGAENDISFAFKTKGTNTPVNQDRSHVKFIGTMRAAQIFAFPVWWFDTALKQWRVKVCQSVTQDLDQPFVGQNEFDLMAYFDQMLKTNDEHSHIFNLLSNRNWSHNANHTFPEEMPFKTMFVGLERDQDRITTNNGFLLYQRQRNQQHTCTEWGVPTTAYAPDSETPVPLDLIYIDGILWDGSQERWNIQPNTQEERFANLKSTSKTRKRLKELGLHDEYQNEKPILFMDMIWALCSGYVISRQHCPAGMMFVRIPMAVPLYVVMENGEPMFVHGDENGKEIDLPRTGWVQPDNHHSATLQSVITAIDEHRVIKERFTLKHRKKRNATNKKNRDLDDEKEMDITHKNYQRVHMTQSVEVDVGSVAKPNNGVLSLPKWKLNHQVDIRSHERVRVHRGQKPLSDKDRKWLVDHEYRIYEDPRDITRKDHQRLKFRKRASADHTHWVALKHTRVKEHRRGPEDSQVVKVVRVPDGSVAAGALVDDLTHGEAT